MAAAIVTVSFGAPQQQRGRFDFNLFDNSLSTKTTTTPVPILRFIDRQNGDGSYTYGYESADGTYKIETRYGIYIYTLVNTRYELINTSYFSDVNGEVRGKYGYIDANGVRREVEYGATKNRGFEPNIEGLVLPEVPEVVAYDPRLPFRLHLSLFPNEHQREPQALNASFSGVVPALPNKLLPLWPPPLRLSNPPWLPYSQPNKSPTSTPF